MNGSWVEVMLDASSLSQDLGLPLCDLFENGIYHGHIHSETLGLDVIDADHGASTAPQVGQCWIDPPRVPSLELLIHDLEYFGEAVVEYEIKTDSRAM